MRHDWKRLMAALMCLLLLTASCAVAEDGSGTATELRSTTDSTLTAGDVTEYTGTDVVGAQGRTNGAVNFRSQPVTQDDNVLYVIPSGTAVEVTAVPLEGDSNGWYRVAYEGEIGYIFAELLVLTLEGTEVGDSIGDAVTGVSGEIAAAEVFLHASPSAESTILAYLEEGDQVELLTIPAQISADHWYKASYGGKIGYIQSHFIRVLEAEEDAMSGEAEEDDDVSLSGTDNGEEDSAQADDVSAQDEAVEEENLPSTGEITSASGVHFYVSPSKEADSLGRLSYGAVVELLSIPAKVDEDHWYQVKYNNKTGYIQSIFIHVLHVNADDLPAETEYGYAKLTADAANLCTTPGKDTAVRWSGSGSLLRITGESITSGNYEWYPVYYSADSAIYYVRGDMIQVVTVENGEISTPAPEPESAYGYVITTDSSVNLRIQPGEAVITEIAKNTVLTCVGPVQSPAESGTGYYWYKVKHNDMVGFVRGDYVRVCTSTGGEIETGESAADTSAE